MDTPGILLCPFATCADGATCEACLHVHLVDVHGVRYGEVFGPQDPALLAFCDQHEHLSPSALGV
jgi:hypothetical protein